MELRFVVEDEALRKRPEILLRSVDDKLAGVPPREGMVAAAADPRALGKPLHGPLREYWRYRVGDFRLICDIRDEALRVLVLAVAGRKDAYR